MINIIKNKWHQLSATDRKIYALLVVLVTVSLLFTMVWMPSQQARNRLSIEIQNKKSQLLQMQAQVKQVNALQGAVKLSHSNPEGLKNAVENSAKMHGLSGRVGQITVLGQEFGNAPTNIAGAIKITFASVSFDEWIRWINALQLEHKVRLMSCHVVSLAGQSGLVAVEANLAAD